MNQQRLQTSRKREYLAPMSEEFFLETHGVLCFSGGEGTETFGTVTNRYGEDDFDE